MSPAFNESSVKSAELLMRGRSQKEEEAKTCPASMSPVSNKSSIK